MTIFNKTLEVLHDNESTEGCVKACYECLLTFCNQKEHEQYDRHLVIDFLHRFRSIDVTKNSSNEIQANRLQTLQNRCKSSFEKQVLYELFRRGHPLPDDAQMTLYDGDTPIAEADFYYKNKNIVLFIDGEPHSKGYIVRDDDVKF